MTRGQSRPASLSQFSKEQPPLEDTPPASPRHLETDPPASTQLLPEALTRAWELTRTGSQALDPGTAKDTSLTDNWGTAGGPAVWGQNEITGAAAPLGGSPSIFRPRILRGPMR